MNDTDQAAKNVADEIASLAELIFTNMSERARQALYAELKRYERHVKMGM